VEQYKLGDEKMDDKVLMEILQGIQGTLERHGEILQALDSRTKEHTELLKALEHKSDVQGAKIDNLIYAVARVEGELKFYAKKISENEKDIFFIKDKLEQGAK
jgi:hypothetical protein